MTIERTRDGPGSKEEGPRRTFAGHATTPGKEETGEPRPVLHGTPTGQGDGSPPGDCGVITYEYDPRDRFREVRLTLCGAPDDDGRRRTLAYDFLWGRFARRDDDDGDEGYASDRVPVPVLCPSLTGGAAAEVEALMPAA